MLKTLSILFLLTLTNKAQADYLDVGLLDGEYATLSKFYAKGFIFDAQASKTNRAGIGTGWQHKGAEVYLGIGYNKDTETKQDDIYTFSEIVYRNGRHSIYDLGIDYTNDKASARLGFTWLIDENAGLIVKHDFTRNQLFIGLRRWIR